MQTNQLHCPSNAHNDIPYVSVFYFTATDLHSWWTEHPVHPLHTCYGFVVYITHFPVKNPGILPSNALAASHLRGFVVFTQYIDNQIVLSIILNNLEELRKNITKCVKMNILELNIVKTICTELGNRNGL